MDLSHTLRSLRSMPHIFLGGVPNERAGVGRLAWRRLGVQPSPQLAVTSTAFEEGGSLPAIYAADGGNETPPLKWRGVPDKARSLVLMVEDPDAPTPYPFVHWIAYDIPPQTRGTDDELFRSAKTARNSMFGTGWTGLAPPNGDTPHRYIFQLFALDRKLNIGEHPGRTVLLRDMQDHVIAFASITGLYRR